MESNSTPYKVGDRVRICGEYPDRKDHGRLGSVVAIDDFPAFPVTVLVDGSGADVGWLFSLSEIELVPTKLKPLNAAILKTLQATGSISGIEASAVHRCRDLPKRISELKQSGYKIETEMKHDGTGQRYARYYLVAPVAA